MVVNLPKNLFQVSKNTLFHTLHHPTKELTEDKNAIHKDVITSKKVGDMSLEEVNTDQIKKSRVVLGIYSF